jgi:hypothetical protein
MVKRQMFGRAGLPLLRERVLLTAKSQPKPNEPITKIGAQIPDHTNKSLSVAAVAAGGRLADDRGQPHANIAGRRRAGS